MTVEEPWLYRQTLASAPPPSGRRRTGKLEDMLEAVISAQGLPVREDGQVAGPGGSGPTAT